MEYLILILFLKRAMDFFHKEIVQVWICWLHWYFFFFPARRYLVPVSAWRELPSFLRKRRDALTQCLPILDVAYLMSDAAGALLLTRSTFWFHLLMVIYSIACCSSFQDRLFLVTDKGGKAKEEKVSYHTHLRPHRVVVRESRHPEV